MDNLIDYYQDRAAEAIEEMNEAMERYEAAQDIDWLLLAME